MPTDTLAIFGAVRSLLLSVLSFALAMAWTPLLTAVLYKYKLGKHIRDTGDTPIYSKLHAHKKGTPTMGGLLVWITTIFIVGLFWLLTKLLPESLSNINFLSRSETWLPLAAFVAAAIIGLVDDLFNI